MPSTKRRAFLASASAALVAASGCAGLLSSKRPAHTVSVYLGNREATHEVLVSIRNEAGDVLFEQTYTLSDNNEAVEDATFSESTDPDTVVVNVDGTGFERDWPGIEKPQLPCEGDNWAGIEIRVEGGPDDPPGIRIGANCQHVTME